MPQKVKKNVKILFFCAETFPVIYSSVEKIFNEYLREYNISFVWIMPSEGNYEIKEIYWKENPVILIPKLHPNNISSLFAAYVKHLHFLNKASQLALKHGPFHIVQVRDDPAMAYIAWRLKKKLKIPFVYQISHLKEEEVILYSNLKLYGYPIKNWLQGKSGLFLRNFFLKKADLIFPISEQMKKTLSDYGIASNKMVVIPEGVDVNIFIKDFDKEAQKIREKMGLRNKIVLVYVGTLNRLRKIEFLFEVLKLLLKKYNNLHLLILGKGRVPEDEIYLKQKARELGVLDNVSFIGWVSKEKVPYYIRASDICLSPLEPNKVFLNSSPIKILEYLALEKPVVCSDIPDQKNIIEKSGGGICTSWNPEKFAQAVEKLLNLPKEDLMKMSQSGRAWVMAHRNFKLLSEIAYNAYKRLL